MPGLRPTLSSRRTALSGGLRAGLVAFITLLGGSVAACARALRTPGGQAVIPVPAPALKAPLTYVALGASDAAGVGVDDPARDGWVPVLSRRLPQPARLVNLGIPGIKLREALEVALPPALDARPDLVTIWLVVNDVLGGVPLDQYRADLDRLLGQLRAGTRAYVAVGNIPDAPETSRYLGLPPAERRALTAQWNEAIAATARTHDAVLVDLFAHWPLAQHPDYIGSDGLHPTAGGYRALAEAFLDALRGERIVS